MPPVPQPINTCCESASPIKGTEPTPRCASTVQDLDGEIYRLVHERNRLAAHAFDVAAVKEMRRGLDERLQTIKGWKPSRERSLTITKLQEAIMWLGMDLKRLNEPNPYPSSYSPESPVIEPTADGLKL